MCPEGPIEWGSSRIRVYWVSESWDDAELLLGLEEEPDLADTRVVITQHKSLRPHGWREFYRLCRSRGIRVVADVCDPMWFFMPQGLALMQEVDMIVASNDGLAKQARQDLGLPTMCIPDRHKIEAYTVKEHKETDCPILLWHGTAWNRAALWNCVIELNQLWAAGYNFKVVLVDQMPNAGTFLGALSPYSQVERIEWKLDTFYSEVLPSADIGLVPGFPGKWGTLKSNNKEVCFWVAGVPTVKGDNLPHLARLIEDWGLRAELGAEMREVAVRDWGIERSVADWSDLVRLLG